MKKIVRVEVTAELEVDTSWYTEDGSDASDEEIIEAEKENWQEWIHDSIINEKISIRNKK